MSNNANGKWITTDKGVHIFIKNGQSVEEAFDDFDIDNGVDFDVDFGPDFEIEIQPKKHIQEEKNPVPTDTDNYKDGYKVEGNKATLGKGRIDYLIDYYGVWNDSDYAKAYLAYIDIDDFVNATLPDSYKNEIEQELFEFDLEKMNNQRQTPFLIFDLEKNEVVGHEGRHRLLAMKRAGITSLPIVVRFENDDKAHTSNKTIIKKVGGQEFDSGDRGKDVIFNFEAIPLNYKHYDKLLERFTK